MPRAADETSVTDLDLMLYFDGELSDERRSEVERFLASAPTSGASSELARQAEKKLYGLALVGDYVRETSSVASDDADSSAALVEAIMARIDAPEATGASRPAPVPANDNGKRIWALTAAAVAAAAALVVWGLSDGSAPDAGDRVTMVPTHEGPLPEPAPTTTADVDLQELVVEGQANLGVEVSSVDFGSNTGAIFYVPPSNTKGSGGGAHETPTTVVWLADGDE